MYPSVIIWFAIVFPAFAGLHSLPEQKLSRIQKILATPITGSTQNLEQLEEKYQTLVQDQTVRDLLEFYRPENQDKIEVSIASFTPDNSESPGADLGFGLHVVKRLTLDIGSGKTKTIYINEQWPESPGSGDLLLPDEIRIRTQIYDGPRKVPGSEKLYLSDSIRIAWGSTSEEVVLARRSVRAYDPQTGQNSLKDTRTSVSAPFSCIRCHKPESKQALHFLSPGETRNFEAVVQDSQFKKKIEDMPGTQKYLSYLQSLGKSSAYLESVKKGLLNPAETFALPLLVRPLEDLLQKKNQVTWIGSDTPVHKGESNYFIFAGKSGSYPGPEGILFIDALEEFFEGKHRWWEPQVILPGNNY